MAMLPAEKQKIIDQYKTHDTDTGSSEVQIALLTENILSLQNHPRRSQASSRMISAVRLLRRSRFLSWSASTQSVTCCAPSTGTGLGTRRGLLGTSFRSRRPAARGRSTTVLL